jgi:hypothetical protein
VRPEPAKWTSEAYESLTAAGIVEKLPPSPSANWAKSRHTRRLTSPASRSSKGSAPCTANSPWPAMTSSTCKEIQKLLAEGDDKLSARVRDYERPRKSRDGVLHAADAPLSKS